MKQQDVIEFFDQAAAGWDAQLRRNEPVIARILDNAGVRSGVRVLDVACGTGVLIPDYLQRGAAQVTAIDISPEMARIAREKFPQENVTVLCGDAEQAHFPAPFDCIVIYNAFPHFPEPERLISHLAGLLTPGGTLTVAHGFSRKALDAHHAKTARSVSNGLLPVEALAGLVAIAPVGTEECYLSLQGNEPDFEDGLVRACAELNDADVILTRDAGAYKRSKVRAMT